MKGPVLKMSARLATLFTITSFFITGCATLKAGKMGNGLDTNGNKLYLESAFDQQARADVFLVKHAALTDELKIQYLLACVQESKYQFVRNGTIYSGEQAMQWLRWKRTHPQYNSNPIRTADDFISRVANGSVNTGRPYEVVLSDGHREMLNRLLANELVRLDAESQIKSLEKSLSENKPGTESNAQDIATAIPVPIHATHT